MEFWAFRFEPKCKIGETIEFFYGQTKIAEAKVARIESPGKSNCEGTGRFKNRWKVFWKPETFVELVGRTSL